MAKFFKKHKKANNIPTPQLTPTDDGDINNKVAATNAPGHQEKIDPYEVSHHLDYRRVIPVTIVSLRTKQQRPRRKNAKAT